MRTLLLLFCLFSSFMAFGQDYKVYGKVTDMRMEPLVFASVQVKDHAHGILTKDDGHYEIQLPNGVYEITVTMVGHIPFVTRVVINNSDYEQNFILEEAGSELPDVVIVRKYKDPAESIVRAVIQNKENIRAAAGAYSVEAYIKAVQQDSGIGSGKNVKTAETDSAVLMRNREFNQMAMAEIMAKIDYAPGGKIKEERTGVSRRGNAQRLFYLTATDGSFDFYQNLINTPALSAIPFLSPVSYSGLLAYKYKTLNIERVNGKRIFTIGVKPGRLSNATVEGEMVIDDSAKVLLSTNFSFPKNHLAEYDHFNVQQKYEYVDGKAWMITRQHFEYGSRSNRQIASGYTTVEYRNFDLQKEFPRNYFGTELSSADALAYDRDSSFWNQVRTAPLSETEREFIKYKDSIHAYVTSEAYLDSVDRQTNRIRLKNILWAGQQYSDHRTGSLWHFPTVASLVNPFSFGGVRIQPLLVFNRYSPQTRKRTRILFWPSYGLLNKDINGRVYIHHTYNPFTRAHFNINAGKDFASIYSGDAWINQLKRSNYYLNTSLEGSWGRELFNGFHFSAGMEVAFRRSLKDFKTYSKVDSLFGDVLGDNQAIAFEPYNATYGAVELRYTPFQQYIREPREKIILGSKWPTIYTQWRKGLPRLFNSKINFDYWEVGLQQTMKLGLTGISSYTFKSGRFLNQHVLERVDYKFQRRGDPFLFMNPNQAFQSLDSTFPVFNRFYEMHFVHEFNGALLSKIPLLNKLELREVAGGGFLIAPERDLRYVEVFAGIERAFKWPFNLQQKFKLGLYVSSAISNKSVDNLQFKIGITTWDPIRNIWR